MSVVDRDVGHVAGDCAGQVVGQPDVERVQVVAAIDVDAELEPSGSDCPRRVALDVEVVGRNVGALDAASGRGRGKAVLIGPLLERPDEAGHADLLKAGDVDELVRAGEPVRILVRVIEADDVRIVARPFDVLAEVALQAGREQARSYLLVDARQEAAVLPTRIEDLAVFRPVPVVGRAAVRLEDDAAARQALRDFQQTSPVRDAAAKGAARTDLQGRSGLGPPRPYRNDAAQRIRSVRHGARTPSHVDAFEGRGIGERGAWADAPFGTDAPAVDEEQGTAACQAANRRNRCVALGDLIHAGHGFQRLEQILWRSLRDLA